MKLRINLSPSATFTRRLDAYAQSRGGISRSRAVIELATAGLQAYEAGGAWIMRIVDDLDEDDLPQHGGARPGAGRPPRLD